MESGYIINNGKNEFIKRKMIRDKHLSIHRIISYKEYEKLSKAKKASNEK